MKRKLASSSDVASLNRATPNAAREMAIAGHSSTLLLRSAVAFLKSFASKWPWPLQERPFQFPQEKCSGWGAFQSSGHLLFSRGLFFRNRIQARQAVSPRSPQKGSDCRFKKMCCEAWRVKRDEGRLRRFDERGGAGEPTRVGYRGVFFKTNTAILRGCVSASGRGCCCYTYMHVRTASVERWGGPNKTKTEILRDK